MINLDQVRTLEWKVKQAVQLIVQLRRENDMLRGRLSDTEVRLQELEAMVETFKVTQSQMESGIRSALDELDHLDADGQVDLPPPAPEPEETAPEPKMALEPEPALEADPVRETETEADAAFDEEYAALVAEEAASLVDPAPAAVELVDEPEAKTEEADAEEIVDENAAEEVAEAPKAEAPAASEDRDEQPGLGIF